MSTISELAALANRMTYHRAKAEAMGFKFDRIEIKELFGASLEVRANFTCICGRQESFTQIVSSELPSHILRQRLNVASELWRVGSFSRRHLLEDGYTSEQCDLIEARGRAFDDECVRELSPHLAQRGDWWRYERNWP